LAGLEAGTEYDQLTVTGTASLRGHLNVTQLNGYVPEAASSYVIIAAAALTGAFDEVSGLDFSDEVILDLMYTDRGVELVAVNVDQSFTAGSDVLTGSNGSDILLGGAGDDSIYAGLGEDIIYGQQGDDLIVADGEFNRIDGGDGIDTLRLSGNMDLSNMRGSQIDRIEVIRIDDSGSTSEVIVLDGETIKNTVDGENELTGVENSLVVIGNDNDIVRLYGEFGHSGEQQLNVDGEGQTLFQVYTDGESTLFVNNGVRLDILDTFNELEIVSETGVPWFSESVDFSALPEQLVAEAERDTEADGSELNIGDILNIADAGGGENIPDLDAILALYTDPLIDQEDTGIEDLASDASIVEQQTALSTELIAPFTHSDIAISLEPIEHLYG
jgi:hypothetical protein